MPRITPLKTGESSFESLLQKQIHNFYVAPDENNPRRLSLYRSYERDVKKVGLAHLQQSVNSLVSETLAIRPGFSGVPLFVEVATNYNSHETPAGYGRLENIPTVGYLAGMLNKVELNGSRSLGTSLPEILSILPLLWKASDPIRDVYVDSNRQSVQIRYKYKTQNDQMLRSQELVFRGTDGRENVYTEVCQDTTLESSEWKNIKTAPRFDKLSRPDLNKNSMPDLEKLKKELLKGQPKSIIQKRSGGDYGEGGGELVSLGDATLMTTVVTNIFDLSIGNLTSYKRSGSCQKAMLQDSTGKMYDTFFIKGQEAKATNISEAYDLLTGLTPLNSTSNCFTKKLESSEDSVSFYSRGSEKYYYYRAEGVATDVFRSALDPESTEPFEGFIHCNPSTQMTEIRFLSLTYGLHLLLGDPKRVQGLIAFSGPEKICRLELNKKHYSKVNHWKHQIRSAHIDMDISIGTHGRILSLKFLKVPNECQITIEKFPNRDFWMAEENFSSPEQIEISFPQNSWIRSKRK